MKIHHVEQNSVDWQILRSGKVTASELDALVSPTWKIRTGEGVKTYLARKVSEAWTGGPVISLQGIFDIDQGKILEEYAKPYYTLITNEEITNVGFIETDDGRMGCSPDGLLGEHSGIEIKCPRLETHVGYLLNGELPSEYAAQVHGSMFVTGRSEWKFMSYRRNMPPFILTVNLKRQPQNSTQRKTNS